MKYSNGDFYTGEWREGQMHGKVGELVFWFLVSSYFSVTTILQKRTPIVFGNS